MLDYERLDDLLSAHDAKPYSGRGMYGRQCLSVVTEEGQKPLRLLADIITGCDDLNEAAELLRKVHTDSMGKETVLYWPGILGPVETP